MKRTTFLLLFFIVALAGSVVGSVVTYLLISTPASYSSVEERQNRVLANYRSDSIYNVPKEMNFLKPAEQVVASVVHIRVSYGAGTFSLNPLEQYLSPHTRSSGSGVIVSDDGLIITNYHVIEDATNIEVVLNNNQRFYAKLLGTDRTTDLALLKIKASHLPFLRYGDSDNLNIGEWVLAVGNPFDLNSTVTAGIVSARARNIGVLQERNGLQVESFIQTDAAVNPGNSGGALVNLRGELIGINSAIATATGSFSGYSFAIPVSLVKKVIDDLLEFGQVQRGLLGVQIFDVDADLAEQLDLKINQGVLITHVNEGSAAAASQLKEGDVITGINNHPVRSVSELQEWVARNRPGKEIDVRFIRNGEEKTVKAKLKTIEGSIVLRKKVSTHALDDLTVEEVSLQELTKLNLEGGIRVKEVKDGRWKKAGLKKDFIIGFMDRVPVDNIEDFNRMLEYKRGGILIEGYYPSGEKGVFGVDW